jgi:hypothetical protein
MVERVNQGPRWKLTAPEPTPRACVIANNRELATEARFLAVIGDLDESDDASEANGAGEPGERLEARRPRTRAECEGTQVCPWVGCKWHLMLDVDPRTGAIKVNYPGVALEDMLATCALEVIDNAPNGITQRRSASRSTSRARVRGNSPRRQSPRSRCSEGNDERGGIHG